MEQQKEVDSVVPSIESERRESFEKKSISRGKKIANFLLGAMVGIFLPVFLMFVLIPLYSEGPLYTYFFYLCVLALFAFLFYRKGLTYAVVGLAVVSSIPLYLWGSCAGLIW